VVLKQGFEATRDYKFLILKKLFNLTHL